MSVETAAVRREKSSFRKTLRDVKYRQRKKIRFFKSSAHALNRHAAAREFLPRSCNFDPTPFHPLNLISPRCRLVFRFEKLSFMSGTIRDSDRNHGHVRTFEYNQESLKR